MPSFVNNENSPIFAPNQGVLHLDREQYYLKPVHHHTHTTTIGSVNELTEESLDDNSSSHSSDTSDPRARMNGDANTNTSMSTATSMSTLPNGGTPTKGLFNGLNGLANNGTLDGREVSRPDVHNGQNGFSTETRSSTEQQYPAVYGKPSTPLRSPPPPPIPTEPQIFHSQSHLIKSADILSKRSSVESSTRTSMHQTPVETTHSKLLPNVDKSPRIFNDAATNSSSPALTAPVTPEPYQRMSSSPNRFPSPNPSASTLTLQPPNPGIKHRHTLEVPRLTPGRGSKDGADTSYASGRFSPTSAGPVGRRASFGVVRRNTRSLHSDNMPRDEVVPDDDALRWAEAYRQKRAKKKKKEELDDDRVLVGTKVDENHANWVTAYNMLTGIRVSVSRTNAKLDRPLSDADFEAKQKSTFDIAGNELVPSAKYDFKFKDYAPWVFRHLRALFRLDPADYLMSLTGKYILSELGSPGKSGSFFYFSRDYKYIIKTIHHAEHKFLRKILKDYYNHVTDNPNTLLSQFYGLHRVKMPYGKKIHFVVMNNLFPPHRDIHQTFDLKGSTVGREYKEENLEKNPRATLKDLNWLRRKRHLELGIKKKQLFLQQLEQDVRLLQKLKIMDYSLLIGVHDRQKGNEENLRGKTLQVFNPGGDGPSDDMEPQGVLMRTPSKLESARKARELRQMIKAERPVPMGETAEQMPNELEAGYGRAGIFYNDDGGLRATHEDNTPGEEVYYLGVIDCLTHYGVIKKIEHFWKGLSSDRTQISALPPQEYGERFINFMAGVTRSPEEAEREEKEREAAAAAAEAAGNEGETSRRGSMRRNSNTVPPVPGYLPPPPPNMHSTNLPEPNPTVEKATKKAMKKEKDLEEELPDRKITTTTTASAAKAPHAVLPVVEEAAEAVSVGGRSIGDNASGSRPFTPSRMEGSSATRADGFTNLGPHGIGGRGPPTPPKTSYLDPETRSRSGSGASAASAGKGSIGGRFLRSRISRESLDKALPPLPRE